MKKITPFALLIVLISFTNRDNPLFEIKSFKKDYAKIKDGFYVCKYEVSNIAYRNFLTDLLHTGQVKIYQVCLPDTLCWKEKLSYNEPYVEYYFRYPAFDKYPVVGISYEAATEYCSWLTQKYNQDPGRKFKKVTFRLLNKEEWTYAANKGDTTKVYTWGSGFIQNNRKQYLCNFKQTTFVYDSVTKKYNEIPGNSASGLNDRTTIAGAVNSFYPNSFGLYNMCGNVAEMIEEKGIAKGGSYEDPSYKVTIASEKKYSKPQADIGFRVAMKVIEE